MTLSYTKGLWYPTPSNHPTRFWPGYSLPLVDPKPFERLYPLTILDQGHGESCVSFAATQALMIQQFRRGLSVLLNPEYLYINLGSSCAGEVSKFIYESGICESSLDPFSEYAKINALKYRATAIPLFDFYQVISAVSLGMSVLFDVQCSKNYKTDSDGSVIFLGHDTNHEQVAACGLRLHISGWQVLGINSWGDSWGHNGYGWFGRKFFDCSDSLYAII